jgi:hypothetical protein
VFTGACLRTHNLACGMSYSDILHLHNIFDILWYVTELMDERKFMAIWKMFQSKTTQKLCQDVSTTGHALTYRFLQQTEIYCFGCTVLMMVPDTLRSSSCEDLCSNVHFHQTRPNRMIDGRTNMQKARQSCLCPASKCNERRLLASPSVCKYLNKKDASPDRGTMTYHERILPRLVVLTLEASHTYCRL